MKIGLYQERNKIEILSLLPGPLPDYFLTELLNPYLEIRTPYFCPRPSQGRAQGGLKNGRRTLKIFWEDWYAREISRFVCNEVRLF